MSRNLYPKEMRKIATLVSTYQLFEDTMNTIGFDGEEITIEHDTILSYKVYDINGEEIGSIGWTDDGAIGFILSSESE